jgi:hypothetical protein
MMKNENATHTENKPYRFRHLGLAFSFWDRCQRPMRVMLGEDGWLWVVTPADSARLELAGYEMAR